MHADPAEVEGAMTHFLANALQHGEGVGTGPAVWLAKTLQRWVPAVFNIAWRWAPPCTLTCCSVRRLCRQQRTALHKLSVRRSSLHPRCVSAERLRQQCCLLPSEVL